MPVKFHNSLFTVPFDNFTLDYMAPKNGRKFQAVSFHASSLGFFSVTPAVLTTGANVT